MPISLSKESVVYPECPRICAQINAGFGCIGAEALDIMEVHDQLTATGPDADYAYIGLHEKSVGNWDWADDTCNTTLETHWNPGDSGMGNNKHCMAMRKGGDATHVMCCIEAQCVCDSDLAPWSEQEFCQDSCGRTIDPYNQSTLCTDGASSVTAIKLLLLTLLFTACGL